MDEPITVSYRWSAKEMLLAQRLHMRYSKQGRRLRRIFIGFTVMFTLIGIPPTEPFTGCQSTVSTTRQMSSGLHKSQNQMSHSMSMRPDDSLRRTTRKGNGVRFF